MNIPGHRTPPARRAGGVAAGSAAVCLAAALLAAVGPLAAAPAGRGGGGALSPAEVKQAQQRLLELGYWAGAADGRWDAAWHQALVAFQKMEWRKRTGALTRTEWNEIVRATPAVPRESGPAHIEVDLARQVFYMVDEAGVLSHILPISSGSGRPFRAPSGWRATADTPCGHFAVFARGYGWHHSELGDMFNPLYVVGGIAIHGSLDVPPRPASHGCIRIPMYASRKLPKLVPREMPVVVYGCKDEAPAPLPAATVEARAPAQRRR
jgi:L,D-transpeptidase catalytic domain/Putative peptidoglycan binding domain